MTDRWTRIEKLFSELVRLPRHERTVALSQVGNDDPEIRDELESLLALEEPPQSFLGSPPALARELRRAMTGQFLEGRELGHYVIERLVQEGGMSLVFKAHDKRDGRMVALKLLQPEAVAKVKGNDQIKSEVEALRGISHPAVVKLIDYGEDEGFHYLVMEFVEGRTLREVLSGMAGSSLRMTLNADAATHLATQFINALAAVHSAGLVHADIKPENLMITPAGRLCIIDFGLSTLSPTPLSVPETVTAMAGAGTLAYSAPELIRGSPATPRSDIFAAGCVLFEILTCQQLYRGRTAWAVAENILQKRPSFAPVPSPWRSLISRCVKHHPEDRFPDGLALENALPQPVETKPTYRLAAVVFAIVLALLLVTLRFKHLVAWSTPGVGTYDLTEDWRANRNPNGVWTYAQGETPLTYQPKLGANGCWGREQGVTDGYAEGTDLGSGCNPAFLKATGDGIHKSFQKGDVVLCSQDPNNGPNEGPATLLWTAPTSGSLMYHGEIWYAEIGVRSSDDFTLSLGSKVLEHGSVFPDLYPDGRPKTIAFSSSAPLKVQTGQKVKLRVVRANQAGSLVGVRLTITETVLPQKQ